MAGLIRGGRAMQGLRGEHEMGAALLSREYVPSGFEVVIADGEMCPGSSGGIWNLWWNVRLTDDPDSWDREIRSINAMQDGLDALTVDQRLIRAQMAEFCRLSPLFPHSVQILCEEIGTGRFSAPVRMGCEGRGLLNALGYNDAESLREQQSAVLAEYVLALERWLSQSQPETRRDSKVFGFLGQPTKGKEAFVRELAAAIDVEEVAISSLKQLSESECGEAQSRPRPFNCYNCDGSKEGPSGPGCSCCWAMIIDAGLLCAGASEEPDAQSKADADFRRFVEEHILAYASAINSWLEGASPRPIASPTDVRYIGEDRGLAVAQGVHAALGVRDDAKEWLAACLLKTVKDNQRWHERGELIDGFPKASSWLAKRL
jgi:hypothetical protein